MHSKLSLGQDFIFLQACGFSVKLVDTFDKNVARNLLSGTLRFLINE